MDCINAICTPKIQINSTLTLCPGVTTMYFRGRGLFFFYGTLFFSWKGTQDQKHKSLILKTTGVEHNTILRVHVYTINYKYLLGISCQMWNNGGSIHGVQCYLYWNTDCKWNHSFKSQLCISRRWRFISQV